MSTAQNRRSTPPSAARLAANRVNARHSTGPRTPEGKARTSRNAVKHGLFSQALHAGFTGAASAEQRTRYDAVVADVRKVWAPTDSWEELVVDQMASLVWRTAHLCELQARFQRAASNTSATPESPASVVSQGAAFTREQERTLRMISKLQRDLVFLRRWNRGDDARHGMAKMDRELEALMKEFPFPSKSFTPERDTALETYASPEPEDLEDAPTDEDVPADEAALVAEPAEPSLPTALRPADFLSSDQTDSINMTEQTEQIHSGWAAATQRVDASIDLT